MGKRKQSSTCEPCNTSFSCDQDFYAHLLTKDHMIASEEAVELRRPFCLSDPSLAIVARGFSLETSISDLLNAFKPYGEVRQFMLKKVSKSEAEGIIEYADVDSIKTVLKQRLVSNGKALTLKRCSVMSPVGCPGGNSHKRIRTDAVSNEPSSSSANSLRKTIPVSEPNGILEDTKCLEPPGSKYEESTVTAPNLKLSPLVPSLLQAHHSDIDEKLCDEKIIGFVTAIQASLPVHIKGMEVCRTVETVLQELNPEYKCYAYGSSFTGLCWEKSCLNIYVQCGQVEANQIACSNTLRTCGHFHEVKGAAHKPVHISCRHWKHEVSCEISFSSKSGVFSSLLIKILLLLDARVQPIVVFLKYWCYENRLVGTHSTISSYCLTWMIIFFLQQQNILPETKFLDSFVTAPAQWDVSFSNLSTQLIEKIREEFLLRNAYQERSLGQLLVGFFDFYSMFSFEEYVICPMIGGTVPRTNFELVFDTSKAVCLQDPIGPKFNIGERILPVHRDNFKSCCLMAAQVLTTERTEKFISQFIDRLTLKIKLGPRSMFSQREVFLTVEESLRLIQLQMKVLKLEAPTDIMLSDRSSWISDLFVALVFLLNRAFNFELTVCPKNSCTDEVLNKMYVKFEGNDKLDLDCCVIIYCEGNSVLFHSRSKPKLPDSVPMSVIEKLIKRNGMKLARVQASTEEKEKNKFCLVCCFNPLMNRDRVDVAFMRYFNQNSIPGKVSYQCLYTHLWAGKKWMAESLSFVRMNRDKLDLPPEITRICADYAKQLNQPYPFSTQCHTSDPNLTQPNPTEPNLT